MAESIEDLNLPTAIVQRLIKEALPKEEKITVSKDVRLAAGKAASMFILHLTIQALSCANEHNRKTLTAMDVIEAIEDIGFEHLISPLTKSLEELQKNKRKSNSKKNDSKNVSNVEEMEVDVESEEEAVEEEEGEEEDDEDAEK